MENKIYELLKDYPELQTQYLFYNCFIISSEQLMSNYEECQKKFKDNLKDVEIYCTPQYIYTKNAKNPLFKKINENNSPNYIKRAYILLQFFIKMFKSKRK